MNTRETESIDQKLFLLNRELEESTQKIFELQTKIVSVHGGVKCLKNLPHIDFG